tara:strand:+ start:9330 stop:10055 length:726 start_codon:yes stop_codon:yes gene_type:complete
MFYYLGVALQVYCVYHCYTNRNSYYWIFAILFLPVVGALLYLFMNVFNKKDIDKVQDGLTAVINPTKKITDLEKKFKFAETFENQVALADAYLEAKMYDKAIENYEASLKDLFKNDAYALSKLLEAYYFSSQWDKAITIGENSIENTKFKKSKASFLYALALEKNGNIEKAEEILLHFDAPYSNYQERLELANFFIRNGKAKAASELLDEMIIESERMSKVSFRQNASIIRKVKELKKANI